MKYLCGWTLRGFPAEHYSGEIEVPGDDEVEACRLAQRIIWARDFCDRPRSFIKVWIVEQTAEAA